MSQKKKVKVKKNKIVKFLKSQSMISLIFALLVLFLMIFNQKILQKEKIYVIEGNNKNTVIKTGSISMNNKIIFFNGPTIKYSGEDITLKNYKYGFYVKDKKIYEVKKTNEDVSYSLKTVLENSSFNFMDGRKGSRIYTKKVVNNIEKMKFKLVGKTEKGKKISITIPLMVSEV